jgi:hypothetical protein
MILVDKALLVMMCLIVVNPAQWQHLAPQMVNFIAVVAHPHPVTIAMMNVGRFTTYSTFARVQASYDVFSYVLAILKR